MKPSTEDPYDILGLPATATLADIKQAFRRKAAAFHPDRNPDPEAAVWFRRSQQAYELLSDESRRREFDLGRQRHLLDNPKETARAIFKSYLEAIE